jgi:hypothetical protein
MCHHLLAVPQADSGGIVTLCCPPGEANLLLTGACGAAQQCKLPEALHDFLLAGHVWLLGSGVQQPLRCFHLFSRTGCCWIAPFKFYCGRIAAGPIVVNTAEELLPMTIPALI